MTDPAVALQMTSTDKLYTAGFKKDEKDEKVKATDAAIKKLYIETKRAIEGCSGLDYKLSSINLSRRVLIVHVGGERQELSLHRLSKVSGNDTLKALAMSTLAATEKIFTDHDGVIGRKNRNTSGTDNVHYGGKTTATNSVIATFNVGRSWLQNGINEDVQPLYSGQVRDDLRHCQELLLGSGGEEMSPAEEDVAEKDVTKQLVKVEAFFYERNYELAQLANGLDREKSRLEKEIAAGKKRGVNITSLTTQLGKVGEKIDKINHQKESNGKQYDRFAVRQYLVYSYMCHKKGHKQDAGEFGKFATEGYKRLAPKGDVTVGLTKDYLSQLPEYVKPKLVEARTFGMSLEIGMAKGVGSLTSESAADVISSHLYLLDQDVELDGCTQRALTTATSFVEENFPAGDGADVAAFRGGVKAAMKTCKAKY